MNIPIYTHIVTLCQAIFLRYNKNNIDIDVTESYIIIMKLQTYINTLRVQGHGSITRFCHRAGMRPATLRQIEWRMGHGGVDLRWSSMRKIAAASDGTVSALDDFTPVNGR